MIPVIPAPIIDSWLSPATLETIRSRAVTCSSPVFSISKKHLGDKEEEEKEEEEEEEEKEEAIGVER